MAEIIHRELFENGEVIGYEYGGRLVRCKDCVYCKRFNDVYQLPKLDVLICRYCCDEDEVTENDYCSWGERKEDGRR